MYINIEHLGSPCAAEWQWQMDDHDFQQPGTTLAGYSDPYHTYFEAELYQATVYNTAANTNIKHGADGYSPVFLHWQPELEYFVDYKTKWTVIWCVIFAACWAPILAIALSEMENPSW